MTHATHPTTAVPAGWYTPADCDLADFRAVVEVETRLEDYPQAAAVESGVLVYGRGLADRVTDPDRRREVQAELVRALRDGPGVVVFQGAFEVVTVEAATSAFRSLIDRQRAEGGSRGDHFGKPGANDRVWGALDKLAVARPDVFVDYYANDVLALVSEAWLGPHYQVTSQVNVVNPGGVAQTAHRDYHLGFMDGAQSRAFPAHVHALSPVLTLQGAVAHCDMPVETGPTMLLPHSQKYGAGYVAFHDPAFTAYFEDHHVQLPLATGDAVFFNPALFHGAGTNRTTDVARMANLLQVSSAFGRAMETVDTAAICRAVFPELVRRRAAGVDHRLLANLVTVAAEGYAFPTNLDLDQPVGSMAPPSQADVLTEAVADGWSPERLAGELAAQQQRRRSLAGGATTL
ncbi:MAG: phytanoyl-CoA dioxygenase family protein [Nocardioidaceae bacterium]